MNDLMLVSKTWEWKEKSNHHFFELDILVEEAIVVKCIIGLSRDGVDGTLLTLGLDRLVQHVERVDAVSLICRQ